MGAKEIKKQKIGKPAHGFMICDVVPWKNTKNGMPRFQRKTLDKKWHAFGLSNEVIFQ
jgi:hypothetical protein